MLRKKPCPAPEEALHTACANHARSMIHKGMLVVGIVDRKERVYAPRH